MVDSNIIHLIKALKTKNRGDIAALLVDSKLVFEPIVIDEVTHQSSVNGLVIHAPPGEYEKLQSLSEDDKSLISDLFSDIRLAKDTLVWGVVFDIRSDYEDLKSTRALADSWLERAKNKLDGGKESLNNWHYPEAISSFQECIEFSLKVAFLMLVDKYPKDHKFGEDEFKEMLNEVPKTLKNLEFHKLYLYSKFWSNFYTTAKYGLENFGVGAEKLFGQEEAGLASKHADKCYFASMQLRNYLKDPW